MARDVESLPPDGEVKGQVGRRLANAVLTVVSLGVLVAWAYFGLYQLDPGENAVILTLGRYSNTVETPGLKWHLPPPIQAHDIVRVDLIEREQFGFRGGDVEASELQQIEGVIQTKANNVAHVGFVVQYKIKDAKSKPRQAKFVKTDVFVNNVFGSERLTALKPLLLCVPATVADL